MGGGGRPLGRPCVPAFDRGRKINNLAVLNHFALWVVSIEKDLEKGIEKDI